MMFVELLPGADDNYDAENNGYGGGFFKRVQAVLLTTMSCGMKTNSQQMIFNRSRTSSVTRMYHLTKFFHPLAYRICLCL